MSFAVETHYAWSVAAHGLATMALLRAEERPGRRAALDKAVRWLCNCRMTMRGSNWDNDAVWGWLYGAVAILAGAGRGAEAQAIRAAHLAICAAHAAEPVLESSSRSLAR